MAHSNYPTLRILAITLAAFLIPLAAAQPEAEAPEIEADVTELPSSAIERVQAEDKTPFRRRIMRDDVTIRIKRLKLESGGKVSLVYGMPKGSKNVPAVFVLDVETNAMATSPALSLPGFSKAQKKEFRQASYLLRSPFGSNMLGSGFAVTYVVADNLETIRSARTDDWIGIFNRVRDLRQVDDNNVFLFSTREYANLSVYLSCKYRFSGFILEEPTYMLFSKGTHEDIIKKSESLTPDEIWSRTDPSREFRYEEVLSRVASPILLIRNPDSQAYAFNEKTLIPKLNQVNAPYETIEIKGPGRAFTVFGGNGRSGVMEVSPEVSYYAPTVSKWVEEILTYMKINSSVDPVALRDPSKYRRW